MNFECATFLPVDKADTAMVLGDLKANDTFMFTADTIQTLTDGGAKLAMYTYCSEQAIIDLVDDYGLQVGWYDYDELNNWDWTPATVPALKNDVALPYGTMYVLQSGNEGAALIYSGKVLSEDKEFIVESRVMNMLGNATPVDITLGDITANDKFAFALDTLQLLTDGGGTKAMYTYLGTAAIEEFGYAVYGLKEGWYDFNEINYEWDWTAATVPAQKNDVPIPAGYGFIVQSGSESAGITIPAAL